MAAFRPSRFWGSLPTIATRFSLSTSSIANISQRRRNTTTVDHQRRKAADIDPSVVIAQSQPSEAAMARWGLYQPAGRTSTAVAPSRPSAATMAQWGLSEPAVASTPQIIAEEKEESSKSLSKREQEQPREDSADSVGGGCRTTQGSWSGSE